MPEHTDPVADKVVLITGAARNLGAVIVKEFASHGARVAVADRQFADEALAWIQGMEGSKGDVKPLIGDASDPTQIRDLVERTARLFGPVDILINNAGPFAFDPFVKLKAADWDNTVDVNLRAIYLFAQQVIPLMNERGWGRIINISAGSAYLRNHSVYGLAKASVQFLTEELALELRPGVTVNAIAPGQIAESAPDISAYDPTFVERAVRLTPAGRLVTRKEIAEMMVLLCSPVFDMVTGLTIPMDGGMRLPRF